MSVAKIEPCEKLEFQTCASPSAEGSLTARIHLLVKTTPKQWRRSPARSCASEILTADGQRTWRIEISIEALPLNPTSTSYGRPFGVRHAASNSNSHLSVQNLVCMDSSRQQQT